MKEMEERLGFPIALESFPLRRLRGTKAHLGELKQDWGKRNSRG